MHAPFIAISIIMWLVFCGSSVRSFTRHHKQQKTVLASPGSLLRQRTFCGPAALRAQTHTQKQTHIYSSSRSTYALTKGSKFEPQWEEAQLRHSQRQRDRLTAKKLANSDSLSESLSDDFSLSSLSGADPARIAVATEFCEAVRSLRKSNGSRKIIDLSHSCAVERRLSPAMTLYAMKSLSQQCGRLDLVVVLCKTFLSQSQEVEGELKADKDSALQIMKLLCRTNSTEGLITAEIIGGLATNNFTDIAMEGQTVDMLWNMVLGYVLHGNFDQTITKLELIVAIHDRSNNQNLNEKGQPWATIESSGQLSSEIAKKIGKALIKGGNSSQILQGLELLMKLNLFLDFDSLQMLASNFMRSMAFVKGAVDLKTLPGKPMLPEFIFMGRSNVGKSSLINMITGRKKLAYTSKTPGKTSEFNYFQASGSMGADNKRISFYLVDLPGVGYAQKSKSQRIEWVELMNQYVAVRKSLRCIFHLIDSRHGLMDADHECLSLLQRLPDYVQYNIVFTKVDKLGTQKLVSTSTSLVKAEILQDLRQEIQKYTSRHVPILYTSSEAKIGGTKLLMRIINNSCKEQ